MSNFPTHVEFELTNACTLRCIMCPRSKMTRPIGCMTKETYLRGMSECKGVRFGYLHQIGEPLLHPNLIEFINDCVFPCSISTNGMFLNEEISYRLLGSRLSELIICIDGTDKETHEKIRPNSDFDLIVSNTKRLLKMRGDSKVKVVVQMIEMNENRHQINDFKNCWGGNALVKGYSTFAGSVVKGESVPLRNDTCDKPFNSITIQWNGDVVPCCRDYNGSLVMGNINNQTIKEIWDSEKYNNFRDTFKTSKLCRSC